MGTNHAKRRGPRDGKPRGRRVQGLQWIARGTQARPVWRRACWTHTKSVVIDTREQRRLAAVAYLSDEDWRVGGVFTAQFALNRDVSH